MFYTTHGHPNLSVPFKFFLAEWATDLLPKERKATGWTNSFQMNYVKTHTESAVLMSK
jgi:hypothetical protein